MDFSELIDENERKEELLYKSFELIEALNGLYDKGKACSWRTPEDDD